jgi:hypothetical protein
MNETSQSFSDALSASSGALVCSAWIRYLGATTYVPPVLTLATSLFITTLVTKAASAYDRGPFERLKRSVYQFITEHPRIRIVVSLCLFVPGESFYHLRLGAGITLGVVGGLTADTHRNYCQIQSGIR